MFRRIQAHHFVFMLVISLSGAAVVWASHPRLLPPQSQYTNSPSATTDRTGKPGSTNHGCVTCHGAQNVNVVPVISGPAQLYPGDYGNYRITTSVTGVASTLSFGFDLAASDASAVLAVVGGDPTATYDVGGTSTKREVTHAGVAGTNPLHQINTATNYYRFVYTMPAAAAAASTHTLYGIAGGNGNGNPTVSILGWNDAANVTITTKALPTTPSTFAAGTPGATTIPLSWTGGGPQYRIMMRTDTYPTSPTDGTDVYDGAGTSTSIGALSNSTQYYFTLFSKDIGADSGTSFYSTTNRQATATTTARSPMTFYVNASTGNNSNLGTTPATAVKTITQALTLVLAGDTINVASGAYNMSLGETFPLNLVSGVNLMSASGAASTTLDATGANNRVIYCTSATTTTIVDGFTVQGGLFRETNPGTDANGGGIYLGGPCSAQFKRNIITGNQVLGFLGTSQATFGGAAYGGGIFSGGSAPRFENNVFYANTAQGGDGYSYLGGAAGTGGNGGSAFGGGMYVASSQNVQIVNNTAYGNSAKGGKGGSATAPGATAGNGGGGFGGGFGTFSNRAANNIFMNNSATGGAGGTGAVAGTSGSSNEGGLYTTGSDPNTNNIFFNNTPNNSTNPGTSPIVADPQFVSAGSGDFHVNSGSPATGSGTATNAPTIDLEGTARPNPPSIGAYEPSSGIEFHGDFNGDHKSDILLRDSLGNLGMWLMNGTTIATGAFVGSPGAYTVAGIGDLNGDGKSDIVLRDSTGTIGVWFMNGATITSGALIGSPGAYSVAAVADFNGDGKADILLRDSLGNLGIWFMNGSTITSGAFVGSPGAYTVVAVADFNGDGKADILLRDSLGNLGMWLMNGSTIASGAAVGSPAPFYVVGAADFNLDLKADIILADTTGNVGVWYMNGATVTSGHYIGSSGANTRVTSLGDYNGDGNADILIRNSVTGDIGMWLMSGYTISAGGLVGSPGTSYTTH